MSAFDVEMSMRTDVFKTLKILQQKEAETAKLSAEGKRSDDYMCIDQRMDEMEPYNLP